MDKDKFKGKKVCRVCLLPIIFKDDAWWRLSNSNDKWYPLNIHDRDCRVKVIISGENEWKVSRQSLNNISIKQQSLF